MNKILQVLADAWQNPMAVVLLFMAGGALLVLYVVQARKDNFDLRMLISDEHKQPSIHKLGQLTALIMSTWLLVYMALHNQMSTEYFVTYMGIWAAAQTADKWLGRKYKAPELPQGPEPPQDSK